jgi:alpha-L-fucosidase
VHAGAPPPPFGALPNKQQIQYHREEFATYFHYGISTYMNQRNWGEGYCDPISFNPTGLNTTQWIEVCQRAGIKRVIPIMKHHDGMCYWSTATTNHSVMT